MSAHWTAIIADVHGNLPALEAILADMSRFDVRTVLYLGDVANLGAQPSAALKRVKELHPNCVMGNTDDSLLHPRTAADVTKPDELTPRFLDIEHWCAEQLDDADSEFVASFQPHLALDLAGLSVIAYHGSPASYDDNIRSTTDDATLDGYLKGFPARLYLGAHTHEQFVRRYRESVIANPGSVGDAFVVPTGSTQGVSVPVAEYDLLQVVEGQANLFLHRVAYDLGAYRETLLASGMPHSSWWAS